MEKIIKTPAVFMVLFLYGFNFLQTQAQTRDNEQKWAGDKSVQENGRIRSTSTNWYKCDFESDYCGWRNDTTADFQWHRLSEETTTDETGPRRDHTKSGEQELGHYLYIETSFPRKNGDHARLISPTLREQGPFCFRFWHNMHGADVKDLNIKTKGLNSRRETLLSHLSGPWSVGSSIRKDTKNDADWWNRESIDITVTEPINIIIEAVRGKNYRGDIAIDDIELKKGKCPRQSANCDFENNTCGWTQMSGDEFNWLPNSGSTLTKNTGPTQDHTLGTTHGIYLYIETSWPRVEGDKARLLSPKISCDKGARPVFNFWYNMNGEHVGQLRVYVTNDKDRLKDPVWEKQGQQGQQWYLGQVAIDQAILNRGSFYVVIEGERKDFEGDSAIDDVSIAGCRASDSNFGHLAALIKTTLTPPTTRQTTRVIERQPDVNLSPMLPGGLNCDFDRGGICSWKQDFKDDFNWDRRRDETHTTGSGPSSDHTTGNGWFLYIEASSPRKPSQKAVIRSPAINPSIEVCVSFYYHMYGKQMGRLELLTANRGSFRFNRQWTKVGQQSRNETDWKFAKVSIKETKFYEIAFRATVGQGFFSDIAIDDIKVEPFPCKDEPTSMPKLSDAPSTSKAQILSPRGPLSCNFSLESLCQWTKSNNEGWIVLAENGARSSIDTGPKYDHTSGSRGEYVYFEASTPRQKGHTAKLVSPNITVDTPACFHFWYHMYGKGIGKLRVILETSNKKRREVWRNSGDRGNIWLEGLIDVEDKYSVLIIEAERGDDWGGDIALDDFEIKDGLCPSINCDFDKDNCAWVQENDHDDFNWTRNSGHTKSRNTGPSNDHTQKNSSGTYLYIEASSKQRYDDAMILSPVIDPKTESAKCLTFWFHSYGEHVGSINVYKIPAQSNVSFLATPLWSNVQSEGNQWVFATMNIQDELPYKLVIRGIIGLDYLGDIAIDDIKLIDGVCDPCCGENQFRCGNNFCIPKSSKCNYFDDCGDESDEHFCNHVQGSECGTPKKFPAVRENLHIPDQVINRDEAVFESFDAPREGADDIVIHNATSGGALKIPDGQMINLTHPRFLSRPSFAINVANFAGDTLFGPIRMAEKINLDRKKRNVQDFIDGTEEEDENWIDVLKFQKNSEMDIMDENHLKIKFEFLEKSKKMQDARGEHHKISESDWKMMRSKSSRAKKLKARKRRSVKKIVGGVKTDAYNYPWQAAYYISDPLTKSHFFCGATLIDRYWLITAAHCPHLGTVHNIVLGDYDLFVDEDTEQEMIVDAIYLPQAYNRDVDYDEDIALIKLRYPAKESDSVRLVCRLKDSDPKFDEGTLCQTTGWGRTQGNVPGIVRILRHGEMRIRSHAICKSYWHKYTIHESYVCAGGEGANTCRGDSGGPLVCKRDEKFYIVGVTSWGDTQCKASIPGIFTRVQSFNRWINRIMKKHGGCPKS